MLLQDGITPGFRERLLDRGLARGLIWRDGVLPPGSPPFSNELTEDLLDYGHALLAMALRLHAEEGYDPLVERAFLIAGEAIEAAVHRGDGSRLDRGFQRVSAAVAFHLARYTARAYSMLPSAVDGDNLAPAESALVFLLRRRLDDMHSAFSSWLLNEEHSDARVAARLADDFEYDDIDATHTILTTSFMRGLALFYQAITSGDAESAAKAQRRLTATADAARDLRAVTHWWTATLASRLVDELWQLSLHEQIPILFLSEPDCEQWNDLRRSYIQCLCARKRSTIELWPSQLKAAKRALDPADDLVVALPTSSGKTRIAELCILRTLAGSQRVVNVTPLRALSAQVERDLAETFLPLGFSVSTLYGSAAIQNGDAETLRDSKIVVATPEKLDFALRSDPSLIHDVGLIVLDEGHMLGPSEREVHYEALVQRLLRREDASSRRIVCLSALFPSPEEMADLVAWIRQDEPGEPVHSTWRPTRQRFGVLRWLSDAARLDVAVEGESPFVPRFIETIAPPEGSRRQRRFPANKNELTLAAGWKFIEQEREVLIYCALRKSVETLGKLVLKCIEHGVLVPLRQVNPRIQDAMATGAEWLGADHPAVQCLQYGVALHHGGLPRPFLNDVEGLLRSGDCPLTIASPTLAQGLNLSASALLVPSIWRNQKVIPTAEFANVAGRAGRAYVDVEGIVLHMIWENTPRETKRALRNWEQLVAAAKAPRVSSGILLLAERIFRRIAQVAGVTVAEAIDYVTGHGEAWDFNEDASVDLGFSRTDWERDIASLDSAILALLDAETVETDLDCALDTVLEGSLFSRQLVQMELELQALLRAFVGARARRIWTETHTPQRKGYFLAGIGLRAGQFLDANLANLLDLILQAEAAITNEDTTTATEAIVAFAELVFQTEPFGFPKGMPDTWKDALRAWLRGNPASEVIGIGGNDGVDFLEDGLTYRLPWAMEATRVHALALGHEGADQLLGLAPLTTESGTTKRGVITLLRSGLSSREAAINAVESTAATFSDRGGMRAWLGTEDVQSKNARNDWPTGQSRHAWLQFYRGATSGDEGSWSRETQEIPVDWVGQPSAAGAAVVVELGESGVGGRVLTPDFDMLGLARSPLSRPFRYIVGARVGEKPETIEVEFFGPPVGS